MSRSFVLALIALAMAGCGSHSSGGGSSSGSGGNPSIGGGNATQIAALASLNALRTQALVSAMVINDALNTSATRHAGYQAIRAAGLTHYESTDGSTDVTKPDSGNALFTAVRLGARIVAANGGHDISDAALYYEDISSLGGEPAIGHLWNTVYHRIPMMRHDVNRFGFGDKVTARASFPSAGVPTGNGFSTCDFSAHSPGVRTLSRWPRNGDTVSDRLFHTDSESPDPVAGDDVVGTPIHLIVPIAEAWTSVTATLTATGGIDVPLYILTPATDPAVFLVAGEIFLLPQNALAANTTFAVVIHATTATQIVDQSWSFSTGP